MKNKVLIMDYLKGDAKSVNVGVSLRQLRVEKGITIRSLATLSGLSANAISMIERNKTSPSVSTLYKLSEALSIPVTKFFDASSPRTLIVFKKANERTRIPLVRGLWEGLGGEEFDGRIEPFLLTLENGAGSWQHVMAHSGHEFVFCLRGQLEYQVETKKFLLEPGDSLLFAAYLKHHWRNNGNTVTNALILLSGFSDDEHPTGLHLQDKKKS
jgi:transcriptional regulator with XRE-family HTH domain